MTMNDENDPIDLEDEEHSIFGLMAALRDYTVRVSGAFVDRVYEELDRASESGPGVTSVVGGILVQMLNLVCGLAGVKNSDDPDVPADDDDREPEEEP